MSIIAKVTDSKKQNAMKVSAKFTSEEKFLKKYEENEFNLSQEDLKAFWTESRNEIPSAVEEKAPKEPKAPKEAKAPKEPKAIKEPKAPKAPKEPKTPKEKVERNANDTVITAELQAIIDDATLGKSDKFRKLYAAQVSIGQITRIFDTHYSFVKTAVSREIKAIEVAEAKEVVETVTEDLEAAVVEEGGDEVKESPEPTTEV